MSFPDYEAALAAANEGGTLEDWIDAALGDRVLYTAKTEPDAVIAELVQVWPKDDDR